MRSVARSSVAVGVVQDAEDGGQCTGELAAQKARCAVTLPERDEISRDMAMLGATSLADLGPRWLLRLKAPA